MSARRWRYYRTAAGREPAHELILSLPEADRNSVLAEMRVVRELGLEAARHLRGDLYEARVFAEGGAYRVLFAAEGSRGQVLLALEAFSKKAQATPKRAIDTALRRLADWRARGRSR